jgi:hypothetical protein
MDASMLLAIGAATALLAFGLIFFVVVSLFD